MNSLANHKIKASDRPLFITCFIFGILYCSISLVNHYNFRNHALDLGLYTNAIFDYSHLRFNYSLVMHSQPENLLADHFDLILPILSPLQYLFGTYTLLIAQITFILAGGVGIYRYFESCAFNPKLALWATIHFFLFFGIFAAVGYDYHSNVVAAMIVPWFFYYLHKRQTLKTVISFLFILICKENMSLWMVFICLGLMVNYRTDKVQLQKLGSFALVSACYFIVVMKFAMPELSNQHAYTKFYYSVAGSTPSEAFITIVTHPLKTVTLLFMNHSGKPLFDFVKAELHVFLLLSGVFLLFLKPQYLVMLIPVYLQKMLHDNPQMWGVHGQYSIEFAPIVTLGLFTAINSLGIVLQKRISFLVLLTTFLVTVRSMDRTVQFTDTAKIRIYKAVHFTRDYSVKKIHEALPVIPKDAVVSAQSPFLPHLALRKKIYQFPIINDAEFIVFSLRESPYPLDSSDFSTLTSNLLLSSEWQQVFTLDDFFILHRKK